MNPRDTKEANTKELADRIEGDAAFDSDGHDHPAGIFALLDALDVKDEAHRRNVLVAVTEQVDRDGYHDLATMLRDTSEYQEEARAD